MKLPKGLTLIETIMTIAIMGILSGVLMFSIKGVMDLWNFWSFRSEISSQGRIAVMRMVREIRQVRNETTVFIADSSRIQFNDTINQTIDYALNGTNLTRNGNVLASGITHLDFTYYDISNAQLAPLPLNQTNREAIFMIGLELTMVSGDQ
ncbi:MAG: type II secretion system protein, partial [Candidatus Omnitrophica bacterium]|nr:type II secretion system protein [Candidatus Omnitrophota bacterium]